MNKNFDVIVIGGGPAGYIAAIRASQYGLSVACIDEWKNRDGSNSFGGTCLNAGCIPSKALLESSELFHRASHEFPEHGININTPVIDIKAMQKRKNDIVKQLTGGVAGLLKVNKIEALVGHGKFMGLNQVEFTDSKGNVNTLQGKHIVLASGSSPIELKAIPFDDNRIVDSWGALDFTEVPSSLAVVGAGVIGLELGSVWGRLGSEVEIFEASPDFLSLVDRDVAKEAKTQFNKLGLNIHLDAKVTAANKTESSINLTYIKDNEKIEKEFDRVVVAVGRKPHTDNLFSMDSGITLDESGCINVDKQCQTSIPNVYAIGDCVRGPMLAHKGSEEGVMVAEIIAGDIAELNYDIIPSVIYTSPEIAWAGKNELELKNADIEYKVGLFPFAASGRAITMEQTSGMVKMISSKENDQILGVHIIGPMAGELIGEVVLAMEFEASSEDIQRTIHAHPSLSEAIHEASLAVDKRALNYPNKK
ncbi:MAG: dihydrolipoamide dehydrogenase [Woeseiaceae bacterium]